MLLGREHELATALAVCRGAVAGRGSVLVVTGEPGIGKTSLLAAAVGAGDEWRTLRVTGVEAESPVAFATLQGLLWPIRDGIDELEAGQARLLRGVLNLGPALEATTFAIGAATLTLLSIQSRDNPMVVSVDDAQWADVASQEVFCFVGRRLDAERIALLAGVRDGEACLLADERSFARLKVVGLESGDARSLLERSSSEGLAPAVVEALLRVCGGSPLGLIELPHFLTARQRRGEDPLPAPVEVGRLVQRAFASRASKLDAAAQKALLMLAAGESDVAALLRVGVATETIDAVEASGLAERSAGTLMFRHPLVQAAVYGAAGAVRRRQAHSVLASATEGARRAWHLGKASAGPDESVAAALEGAANEARLAGGLAAEAQALESAAELTPDRETQARRLLRASRVWRRAGRVEHADAVVDRAFRQATTIRTRAELQLERGSTLVRESNGRAAAAILLPEADLAAPTEPKVAAQLLVKAALAAHIGANAAEAIAIAERACALAGTDGDRTELEAVNALVEVRTAAGVPPDAQDFALVSRAAELLAKPELRLGSEEAHWIAYCLALYERDEDARRLSDQSLAEARASGDVWNLCYAQYARAAIEQSTGRIDVARAYASEALALAEQIGEIWRLNEALGVLAEVEGARGSPEEAKRAADSKMAMWEDPVSEFYWSLPIGISYLAVGKFEESIKYLEAAYGYVHKGPARAWYHMVPLELAEAYLGVGRRREAEVLIRNIAPEIETCALIRPKGKLARARGMAAAVGRFDAAFAEALALLDQMPQPHDRGRVELAWGERLRRSKRSEEAATYLDRALARFEALGAVGWAERTRRELEAASGKSRQAQQRRTDVLSSQELRIAQHAAAGMRDREIAATLYLSPRTVEAYLQQAYRKLDISNRTQLAAVLAGDGVRTIPPPRESVQQVQ